MHHNASKCMQNELCKGFVHEIIKEWVFITFKGAIIDEIHLPLYGGTPCSLAITCDKQNLFGILFRSEIHLLIDIKVGQG